MRALLDTNVILSGLNYPGSERQALELGYQLGFELVISEHLLEEVLRGLLWKLGWSSVGATSALEELRRVALIVEPPRSADIIPDDHADNRVLECAVHASADYLVTGDRKHLLPLGEFEGVRILRAPEFLAVLDAAG